MYSLLHLVNTLITIFIWLLIAQAVLSWLLAFGVVNRYNRVVASANDFLCNYRAGVAANSILPSELWRDRYFAGHLDPTVVFPARSDVRIPCLTARLPRRATV